MQEQATVANSSNPGAAAKAAGASPPGLRIVCTRLPCQQAELRAARALVQPSIKPQLPSALWVASLRGLYLRNAVQGAWLDARGKDAAWLRKLCSQLHHELQPARDFLICLYSDAPDADLQALPWLEPQLNLLPRPAPDSGFALWRGDEEAAEDALARLLWRQHDYNNRWHDNQGRQLYYPRPQLENELHGALQQSAPFLLVGMPLAGKTRLLLRALCTRGEALLVARPDSGQFQFPADWPESLWLVCDDLDLLLDQPGFKAGFLDFIARHGRWLATCRSGEAYEKICAALPPRSQGEYLHNILVGRLTPQDAEKLAAQLQLQPKAGQRQLPQNIGFYFMQKAVNLWRNVYQGLSQAQKSALRAATLCMRFGASSDLDNLQLSLVRNCASQGLPASLAPADFDAACHALDQIAEGRGWWQHEAVNGRLRLEPVFADQVIDPGGELLHVDWLARLQSALPQQRWLQEPAAIARWAEQAARHGWRLDRDSMAQLQAQCACLQSAVQETGLPARAAQRALLFLYFCATPDLRAEILALLPPQQGGAGLQISLNQLLADFHGMPLAQVLGLYQHLGLRADSYTFNTLLAQSAPGAAGASQRQLILQHMQAAGVAADVFTYTILLEKAGNAQERRELLGQMQAAGVAADVVTYNSLLEKAGNAQERRELLGQMQAAGVAEDVITYNILLEKAGNAQERRELLGQMQAAGVAADVVTFTTLLEKAGNAQERRELLGQMQAAGVAPNVVTFTTLLEKAGNAQERRELLGQMQAAGVAPNVVTYNSLLEKAGNAQERRELLGQMQAAGVAPNVVTFTTLLEKAGNAQERRELLGQMQAAGVVADVTTFGTLIKHAESWAECEGLRQTMRRDNVAPNLICFNSLISHCLDFRQAQALLDELLAAQLKPDHYTMPALVKKAPDFATALLMVEQCTALGARLNEHVFKAWRRHARSAAEEQILREWEERAGRSGFSRE
ncbi:hypothetical protein V8J88_01295 [Massilia sp. W12]|uniref:hypothetical protein n=1 Tax=Massilia sp. W12 TaxID=3126507 RepID=UPI0030D2F5A5